MTRTVRLRTAGAAVAAVALLGGCSGSGDADVTTTAFSPGSRLPGGTAGPPRLAHFEEFADCDAFLEWSKEQMLERVTAYGLDYGYYPSWRAGTDDVAAAETTAPAAGDPDQGPVAPGDGTSTTNTQEIGVDEADLAETDGRFVYSLMDGRLRSVDLQSHAVVSDVAVEVADAQMILFGDRLLLLGQDWNSSDNDTVATQYSISSGALTLVNSSHLEGQLVSTRSVDGVARVVLRMPFASRLPFVHPNFGGEDSEREALQQNKAVIEAAVADDLLPRAYEQGANGASGPLRRMVECTQVAQPGEFSGFNTVWVATIDLNAAERPPMGAAAVIADVQTVYMSADNLYVGTIGYPSVNTKTVPINPQPSRTSIHAFTLDAADGADYVASGEIEGRLLNQYSLSEFEGHLRIATTTDQGGFGKSKESGVHVLERRGEDLVEVGTLGGLGRGEDIQAVRFFGAQAYVVTFLQIDPLFVIDLSDPQAPTLQGELKVPGFSTYLHPIDGGLLLAIGYSGDEFGGINGTQLSLFDVNDPAKPTLLATLPVGSYSEAAFDPHAFLYWPETGQVVVPHSDMCVDVKDCSSAVVAKVSAATLVEQGKLLQWFPIRRTMVVGGDLVTISSFGVRVHDIDTLDEIVNIAFAREQ